MPDWTLALEADGDGVRVRVRAAPRSSRPGLDGLVEDSAGRAAVRLRLAAPPADGRANREAVDHLHRALGVPRTAIALTGGASARSKSFHVSGLSVSEAARRLAAVAGPDG